MKKKSKISAFYMKYTIKKPIIFLCFVFIGVALFLNLTLKIQVPINKTFNGKAVVDQNNGVTILLNKKPLNKNINTIYLYIDKNIKIYEVKNLKIEDSKIYIVDTKSFISVIKEHPNVSLDIEQKNITLFEKIFVNGGKS
jgi:hypothetical protein